MGLIESSQQAVLSLFENELAQVRFPDVDSDVLRQAREQVELLAREVEQAEALLAGARNALQLAREQLDQKCHRAVAYAKVYAGEHPEVAERLSGLEPSSAPAPEPRKRRKGRPEPLLFESPEPGTLSAA